MESEDVVASVVDLSDSQKDRLNVNQIVAQNLYGLLMTKIERARNGSELHRLLESEITSLVKAKDEQVTFSAMVKLFEILTNARLNEEGKILDLLKTESKIEINNMGGKEVSEFDAEDIQEAKLALDAIRKISGNPNLQKIISLASGIQNQEFTQEELDKK